MSEFSTIIGFDQIDINNDNLFVDIRKINTDINSIDFDLINFAKITNSDVQNVKLKLKYDNFGLVEDFKIK